MHLVPFASRDYIAKNGLPDKHNLSDHYILHSSMYTGKSDIWRPWRSILEAGRQGHGSDSSLTYGFMVKAGLGVGLMSSVHAVNAFLVPLDLDCHIQLPLHVVALTERLQSRPVRIVYECLVAGVRRTAVAGARRGDTATRQRTRARVPYVFEQLNKLTS